jgi:hypothetical protein
MLQYVGDAGGIRRDGLKRHAKGVFPIRIADVDVPGAGGFMFQLVEPGVNIRQIGHLVNRVPGQPVSGGDAGIVCVFFHFHEDLQWRLFDWGCRYGQDYSIAL